MSPSITNTIRGKRVGKGESDVGAILTPAEVKRKNHRGEGRINTVLDDSSNSGKRKPLGKADVGAHIRKSRKRKQRPFHDEKGTFSPP